jgi:hypothetical protein
MYTYIYIYIFRLISFIDALLDANVSDKERELANIRTQLISVKAELVASYRENKVHICVYINIYMCMCMHVCMYKENELANIRTQLTSVKAELVASYRENKVHICVYIYIYICVCVCMCVCIMRMN